MSLFVRQGTLFAQKMDPVRLRIEGSPHAVADQVISGLPSRMLIAETGHVVDLQATLQQSEAAAIREAVPIVFAPESPVALPRRIRHVLIFLLCGQDIDCSVVQSIVVSFKTSVKDLRLCSPCWTYYMVNS